MATEQPKEVFVITIMQRETFAEATATCNGKLCMSCTSPTIDGVMDLVNEWWDRRNDDWRK